MKGPLDLSEQSKDNTSMIQRPLYLRQPSPEFSPLPPYLLPCAQGKDNDTESQHPEELSHVNAANFETSQDEKTDNHVPRMCNPYIQWTGCDWQRGPGRISRRELKKRLKPGDFSQFLQELRKKKRSWQGGCSLFSQASFEVSLKKTGTTNNDTSFT